MLTNTAAHLWRGKQLWETLYLLLIRDQHLSGLLDHRLWFQLLVAEAVPPWVKRLLARHAGQRQVCRVGVKVHLDVAAAVGDGWRSRGSSGRGGRILRRTLTSWEGERKKC